MKPALVCLCVLGSLVLMGSSCATDEAAVNDAVGTTAPDQKAGSEEELISLMKNVKLRMTKADVLDVLGKPSDVQTQNSEGYKSECWYYGDLGDWQLCFDDGFGEHKLWLTSKNHY